MLGRVRLPARALPSVCIWQKKEVVNVEGAPQGSGDCEDAQEPAWQKGSGSPPGRCRCLLLSVTGCRLLDFSPCALDV